VSALRDAPRPFWRRVLLPAVALLLGLNGLAFFAYTLPRTLQVRNATARAAALREEIAGERAMFEARRSEVEAVRANAADSARFYREVVRGERADLLALLEDVEALAAQPALTASARSYGLEEVPGAPLTRVAVNLSLKASYEELVDFLDRVERSPRFLTVDRISLSGGGAEGQANLRVEMSAYLNGAPPKVEGGGRRG